MPSSAFVASRRDLRAIQHVMDRGFDGDPTVQWILDTPEAFAAEHHKYVALCAEPAFEHETVHAAGDFEGAAIWYPPKVGISDESFEDFKTTAYSLDRLEQYEVLTEICDQYRPNEPHWTLELIAVDPEAQGKGIGGKLMAFGLAKCDQSGAPSFLVSSNRANLPFYERLGFVQLAEVQMPGLPSMYPMMRRPDG